ncbi:OmpA family protein [Acinetobacter sp. dk771]|uniref:OmpA family protein n=1 Tax=Acinetobacter wanghuae TaxID=2662362 RepID=A0AA91AFF3_9GAMM|nr:OmpA family protein [Acinetobacter wanghuae]MQW92011.1 OmpA family protein [Acinetobacter wanghuae]
MRSVSLKILLGLCAAMALSHGHASSIWSDMTTQLQPALKSTDPLNQYHAHKAQMWLSYAKNEQSENSLTVAGKEALGYSQQLIDALTQSQLISLTTPVLSVSQVMRRDLWWQIEYFKQHGGIQAAPQALAEAEVMLVWAAAEYCELGWRHAKEHFFAVEQRLYQVKLALPELKMVQPNLNQDLPTMQQFNGQGCHGVNSQYWPIQVANNQVIEPSIKVDEATELHVENVVHFALDQADLNAEGQRILDRISALLHEHRDIQITLVGHTDMRASQAYNLKLSQRRINTGRQYLVAKGISDQRIAEQAKGKQDLLQDSDQKIAHAKSRRVVIEFHDIEGKNLNVQPQWRDLQLEVK